MLLALLAATPALATNLRVEAPRRTLFQGNVTPFIGTLQGHTTTKATALGALVAGARLKPFSLGLGWSDSFGGAWNGFYVTSIDAITPPPTAFWALKINQTLAAVGFGAAPVTSSSRVLVYYTTFDPETFATQPTLGLNASASHITAGGRITFTVQSYDDAGTPAPAAGAWVWVNGVASQADATGRVTVRLAAGIYQVRAATHGAIRSRTLWVRAS